MAESYLVECTFLIPIKRDNRLSDGGVHSTTAWDWLEGELWERFRGRTRSPGLYDGVYADKTGSPIQDRSRQYIIAIREEDLDNLRKLLRDAKEVFCQECFYLSIRGQVEFVE